MTKHNPEPLAKIVTHVLTDITLGRLLELNQGEIDALLNDFHRAWNERMDVYFQAEQANISQLFVDKKNLFQLTGCSSRKEIIERLERFIIRNYRKDNRVILNLSFSNHKMDTEWLPLDEYLEKTKKADAVH
ncbi:hypothetical protein ACTL6P_04610 [Endozoicomonas acroporae]|uniref:hypothetical protein n=1 Tax=Endozoicomonas acroporae TaxID=1701104 RepID=UPI000C76E860|nr:hypothetical protein [Endozoicomonas acroporae]